MRPIAMKKCIVAVFVLITLCTAFATPVLAAKDRSTHLLHTDVTTSTGLTYRVLEACIAEDGTLWITAKFSASGEQNLVPAAFILMTEDKNGTNYADPLAVWISGDALLPLETSHKLPASSSQDIVWQFADPGPAAHLVTFVYLDDPYTFYECQAVFNRPIPRSTRSPNDPDPAPNPWIALTGDNPTPKPQTRCWRCTGGMIMCSSCSGKGGQEVANSYYYSGSSTSVWQNCYRCSGIGSVTCDRCGGTGWHE